MVFGKSYCHLFLERIEKVEKLVSMRADTSIAFGASF